VLAIQLSPVPTLIHEGECRSALNIPLSRSTPTVTVLLLGKAPTHCPTPIPRSHLWLPQTPFPIPAIALGSPGTTWDPVWGLFCIPIFWFRQQFPLRLLALPPLQLLPLLLLQRSLSTGAKKGVNIVTSGREVLQWVLVQKKLV
jgi:hypothetical protein